VTWGAVSLAALKRLWPFAGRGFSQNSPQTSADASGIAAPMKMPPSPDETLRIAFYQRGLVLHKGCREKAEAFADRHMILVKVH
jgi:hypothetical protein